MTSMFGSSTKCARGEALGWRTFVSYLSPGDPKVCPWATKGCRTSCLGHSAGRMVMRHVTQAQVRRTRAVLAALRDGGVWAAAQLFVDSLPKRPRHPWDRTAVRVNGTSDLPEVAEAVAQLLAEVAPGCRVYDYTKSPQAAWNYAMGRSTVHLTFSLAEGNWEDARALLAQGVNVAAVVESPDVARRLAAALGASGLVDGDQHDLRFLDPDRRGTGRAGCLVTLKPKGAAKRDRTGFVVRAEHVRGAA